VVSFLVFSYGGNVGGWKIPFMTKGERLFRRWEMGNFPFSIFHMRSPKTGSEVGTLGKQKYRLGGVGPEIQNRSLMLTQTVVNRAGATISHLQPDDLGGMPPELA